MNVRHIGDDFTSLLYIVVTSSVFLYRQPIREGGAWPLTPPPHHSSNLSSTDLSADHQCLGGEDWDQGDVLPHPHATSWKGDRQSWRGKGEGGGDDG
jgi:hypothetical protein